jgi:hypothetical protein
VILQMEKQDQLDVTDGGQTGVDALHGKLA